MPNFSGSHTFSLMATAVFVSPYPPECYYKAKRRLSLISGYSNTDPDGTERSVRIREVSPYKTGHYDGVTFMTPLTVSSVQ